MSAHVACLTQNHPETTETIPQPKILRKTANKNFVFAMGQSRIVSL
jgi:hypothetical protein